MKKTPNVQKTKNLNLCISCEMCSIICPENAIKFTFIKGQFLPDVDKNCTSCGKCLLICPGIDIDPFNLRKESNITKTSLDNGGKYLNTYTAYSKRSKIRENSTSGGIVTDLIINLIEDQEYDSAFVLPFETFHYKPVRLTEISAKENICNSAKSKYIPVSAFNILKTLEKKENEKYIIVATPCIIKGLLNYLEMRKISRDNLLFIGLFCDRTLNYNILKYYEDSFKEKDEKISLFEFRTKEKSGWPGNSKIIFDSERELIINSSIRKQSKEYFQLNRCLFCLNGKLNPLSDISVGDCYLKEEKDTAGKSNIIIRTKKGQDIFNKYSKSINSKNTEYKKIVDSQGLDEKKKNWIYVKLFSDIHNLYPDFKMDKKYNKELKKMLKTQKHIEWGENYQIYKIKTSLVYNKFLRKINLYGKLSATVIVLGMNIFKDLILSPFQKNVNLKSTKNNIVIIGGGLHNKGAQAMTFTTVNELKKKFPYKNIYLFSELDYHRNKNEKDIYNFNISPWNPEIKSRILGLPKSLELDLLNVTNDDNSVQNLKKILKDTIMFIDISGYRLSSLGFVTSLDYLLDIMVAKKFSAPYIILPQSIGPFDYPSKYSFIKFLIKFYLEYPEIIFAREEEGIECLKKMNLKNFEKSQDIVLDRVDDYDLYKIYNKKIHIKTNHLEKNSIGIIPNQRVFDREKEDVLYSHYKMLINTSLKAGKTVYILRHSYDDLEICENIKELFSKNNRVILLNDDFNAIELELILKQFDFIIASRYHSIIHAYRNSVPALVIGWATKYYELLKSFDQLDYFIDVRKGIYNQELNNKIKLLLMDSEKEKFKIRKMANENKKDIFDIIESVPR